MTISFALSPEETEQSRARGGGQRPRRGSVIARGTNERIIPFLADESDLNFRRFSVVDHRRADPLSGGRKLK